MLFFLQGEVKFSQNDGTRSTEVQIYTNDDESVALYVNTGNDLFK